MRFSFFKMQKEKKYRKKKREDKFRAKTK